MCADPISSMVVLFIKKGFTIGGEGVSERNRLAESGRPVVNRPLVVKEKRDLFYGFTRG